MNNLPTLLEISLHWAIWLSLYYLLLYKKTFFKINRIFLVTTLLLGILLPIIQPFFPVSQNAGLVISIPEVVITAHHTVAHAGTLTPQTTNWYSIIYTIGLGISTILFLFNIGKLVFYINHFKKQKAGKYLLVELPQNPIPFSFFHFIFISRKSAYTKQEWNQILAHEQAHSDHFHSVDILLVEIIKIFFWWNPLVYFYKIALQDIHEYQADLATTQNHNKKAYSRLLLRQMQSGRQVAITSNFIHSQLKKRITMMTVSPSPSKDLWRYFLVIPLFVSLFFISCQSAKEDTIELSKKTDIAALKKEAKEIEQLSKELENRASTKEERDALKQKIQNFTDLLTKSDIIDANPGQVSNTNVYKAIEQMPRFEGDPNPAGNRRLDKWSENALINYIYQNIQYPPQARKDGLQGRVIAKFIINETGKLEDIEILRGIGGGCDEEVLKVLNQMNQEKTWIPGQQDGKVVKLQYLLPVKFALQN